VNTIEEPSMMRDRPALTWLVRDEVDPEHVIDTAIVDRIRAVCPVETHVAVAALWQALRRTLATADLDTMQQAGCLMAEDAEEIERAIGRLERVGAGTPIDYSRTFAAMAAHWNALHLIDTLEPDLRGEKGG